MSPANTGMGRIQAQRRAQQLNESYTGPGPYFAKFSYVETAWYVEKIENGKPVERIYA